MTRILMIIALLLVGPLAAQADEAVTAMMFRIPYCSCCDGHAEHLRANGYDVTVVETDNMTLIKENYNVPQQLEGCHTLLIDGYIVEGHVPARVIDRLLEERPAIRGLSLPGMPQGSPGMTGEKSEPFVIYELRDGAPTVYATD